MVATVVDSDVVVSTDVVTVVVAVVVVSVVVDSVVAVVVVVKEQSPEAIHQSNLVCTVYDQNVSIPQVHII